MACDVCGKLGTSLNTLLDQYQTEDIKAICPRCEEVINKQHRKIRDATTKIHIQWLKNFIRNRKSNA